MKNNAKLVIVGDLFPTPINEQMFIDGDIDALFGKEFIDLFKSADYSVCNLEGILTETDNPHMKSGVKVKAKTAAINAYRELGISFVTLANNHCMDYGNEGYFETLEALKANGIETAGSGINMDSVENYKLVDLNGHKVILYCVAETLFNIPSKEEAGCNLYDEYRVCKELEELKDKCDCLVVLYHGGAERLPYDTPVARTRFHRMAESGADIIISQHTHAIGAEEYYNGTYCLYGQGNFLFHLTKKPNAFNGNGVLLEIDFDENSNFTVKKHIAKRVDPGIIYDKKYDLSEFYDRSERLVAGDPFTEEFAEYSLKNVPKFFAACRGINEVDAEMKDECSKKEYHKYLTKCYNQKQLLTMLKYLEAEEFREYAIQGIKELLKKK